MLFRASILPWIVLPSLLAPPPAYPATEPPAVRPLRTGGLKAEVAALIMSGQEGGTIPVEILAVPVRGDGDKARVPLVVEADGAALTAEHQDGPLRIEVYVYALGDRGSLKSSILQTFEVDLDRLRVDLRTSALKFSGELELPPGKYSLRVMVRNPGSGSVGVRVVDLVVPEEQEMLSAPMLGEAPGDWLRLRQARDLPTAPPPLSFFSPAAPPSAKPVIVQGEEVPFQLLAYNHQAVGSELAVEVRSKSGELVTELPARVTSYSAEEGHGYRVLAATFDPQGLFAGDYFLRIVAGGGQRLASADLPVRVLGSQAGGASRVWAAVEPGPAPPSAGAVVPEVETRKMRRARKKRRREIDASPVSGAYEDVLRILAEDRLNDARSSLYGLASTLATHEGAAGLDVLRRVETAAAERIVEADRKLLLPVVLLHHWLYQEALRKKEHLISTHARGTVLRLVDQYRDPLVPQTRKRSAAILASLGIELQEADMKRLGDQILQRALELDPANEVALLAMATRHEKIGEYEEAIVYLEQLLEAHPSHGEGRVRMAVNQERRFHRRAARRYLSEVVAGQHSPWVLSLAYQELAHLHVRAGRQEEAEELLRQGVERLPGDEKLHLALAFLYDARQESGKAQEVLEQLSFQVRRREASARHRYTHWPREAMAASWRSLREGAGQALPGLAEALAPAPEGGRS